MKETTEFLRAGFKTVNAYALAKADGKLDGTDLQFALPLVFTWQEGIKDLRFAQEAAAATPAQIDAAFNTASTELGSAIDPNWKYAFTTAAKGYYATYWGISNTAFQAGRLAALKEVKAKGAEAALKAAGL